jgi:predicted permease
VLDILKVTFPFFALVLCGYVAAHRRWMPLQAIGGLNTFVLYFALPCMLFRFGASTPVARLFDPAVGAVWLPVSLAMVAGTIAVSLNARIRWNDASFGALVAAFPNTGFLGVPLLVALLGPAVAGPMIATVLIDMVVISSLCIALSRLDGAGQGGAALAARKALKGVAINPLPWSILIGGAMSGLGLQLVRPVDATVGLLADAASPVALFTIGAVLARSRLLAASEGQGVRPGRDVWPVILAKLFVHPLLVFGVGTAGITLGLPLDPFALVVITLVAALPSASNVAIVAERFGADTGRIVQIIMWTTAAAFLTLSSAVAWLVPARG